MNRNLVISILAIILALGAGYYLYQKQTTDTLPTDNEIITPTSSFNPRTLSVGDEVDGFVVESVEIDLQGGYTIRLKGEKVVTARPSIWDAFETGTVIRIFADDEKMNPPILIIDENAWRGFTLRNIKWDDLMLRISEYKKILT